MKRLAGVLLAGPLLAGCASLAPVAGPGATRTQPTPVPATTPAPTSVPPSPPAPVPTAPSPGARAWMPADSLPSVEALAVVARLPEPLAGSPAGEGPVSAPAPATSFDSLRTAPPAAPPPSAPRATDVPAALHDSLRIAAPAPSAPASATVPPEAFDSLRVAMPVPSAPRDIRPAPRDSVPPRATPPPAAPPATASAASSDTCWRVQFAAPSERVRAEAMRDAAQSVLVTPVTIELEQAKWKVRSRACLGRAAAEALRDRAVTSGFAGVFLVRATGAP